MPSLQSPSLASPGALIAPAAHWLTWVVHETAIAVPEVPRQKQDRDDERVPEIRDDEEDAEQDLVEGEAHDPCDRERGIEDAFRAATEVEVVAADEAEHR